MYVKSEYVFVIIAGIHPQHVCLALFKRTFSRQRDDFSEMWFLIFEEKHFCKYLFSTKNFIFVIDTHFTSFISIQHQSYWLGLNLILYPLSVRNSPAWWLWKVREPFEFRYCSAPRFPTFETSKEKARLSGLKSQAQAGADFPFTGNWVAILQN
jgi:hypothetical protein